MNNALAILWVLLVIIICIFIYLVISSLIVYFYPTIVDRSLDIYTQCEPVPQTLIQITTNNSKYCPDGNIFLIPYNMIVSQNPIPYINACLTGCENADLSTLTCPDPEKAPEFNECIQLTQPNGCSSLSNPIAFIGTTYYYINALGSC